MNASIRQPPVALGRVERRLDVGRVARQRLLAQHVLAGLERPDRPLAVQRVRQRDVDGLDLRVGEQLLVRAVGLRDLPLRARSSRRAPELAARDRPSSTFGEACAPGMTRRLMCAVETMPQRTGSYEPASPMTAPSPGAAPLEHAEVARPLEHEDDDLGHVLGGHHPRQHLGRAAAAVVEREVGGDAARADVRAADALLAQLVVERAREADLPELRGAVDGLVRQPAPAGLGARA